MRYLIFFLTILSLSACDPLRDEVGYPGGYLASLADRRVIEARAQSQRADRFLMSLVILAPVSADLADNSAQAKSAATLVNASFVSLARMDGALQKDCLSANPVACSLDADKNNSPFAFETHGYDMQRKLFALGKSTLGSADLDNFVDAIIEFDLVNIAVSFRRFFPIARRVLATYRDTVVTFSDAVCKTGSGSCGDLADLLNQLQTGQRAAEVLSEDAEGRLIIAMSRRLDQVGRSANQTWGLTRVHKLGLLYHIDEACARLEALQRIELEPESVESCSSGESRQAFVAALDR